MTMDFKYDFPVGKNVNELLNDWLITDLLIKIDD